MTNPTTLTYRRPPITPREPSFDEMAADKLRAVLLAIMAQHPGQECSLSMAVVRNPKGRLVTRTENGGRTLVIGVEGQ